jgi:hypothetical protein
MATQFEREQKELRAKYPNACRHAVNLGGAYGTASGGASTCNSHLNTNPRLNSGNRKCGKIDCIHDNELAKVNCKFHTQNVNARYVNDAHFDKSEAFKKPIKPKKSASSRNRSLSGSGTAWKIFTLAGFIFGVWIFFLSDSADGGFFTRVVGVLGIILAAQIFFVFYKIVMFFTKRA